MSSETFRDGLIVERWDDTLRQFSTWDAQRVKTSRPYTADENIRADAQAAAAVLDANGQTMRDRATLGLAANAAFLAIVSPSQAQTLAQVKVLTKECTGLIRLALQLLDSTDGT